MNKTELAKKIYQTSHLTGEFVGRSGVTLQEYFDKYLFEANPEILDAVCTQMNNLIPQNISVLAGLEMGGIPIATLLSQKSNLPTLFIRKKAKEHGTCKFAEGGEIQNRKIVIIEDVVTSGGQIILSTNDLRKDGADIEHAICVIDRESGGKEKLAKEGIKLISLFTISELKKAAGIPIDSKNIT